MELLNVEEKNDQQKENPNYYFVVPPWSFMMAWIFCILLVPNSSKRGWQISFAGWSMHGHGLIFCILIIDDHWDPYCLMAISVVMLFLQKSFNILCSLARSLKITSSSANLFSFDGMKKVSKILLTAEEMIAIFPGPLPEIQPHIINESGNLIWDFLSKFTFLDNANSGIITEYYCQPILHTPWLLLFRSYNLDLFCSD